jgi:hypothetical protein
MFVHVSAARHHPDRFHLFKRICFFSADVGSVRQCKISAKYGCSVTVALGISPGLATVPPDFQGIRGKMKYVAVKMFL